MADVIDAIIAEALNQGPEGQAAVAHVIATRAAQLGISPDEVVNQPGQFTGVSNPGRVVAQAMTDPAIRAQVQQVWEGVQSGKIPNPYPRADHYHTDQVDPYWAASFERLGQLEDHIFYASGKAVPPQAGQTEVAMPTPRPSDWAPTPQQVSEARNEARVMNAGNATPWLSYVNQNATRNQPLSDRLTSALAFLPELGVSAEVFSGGQPSAGNGPRVGSVRHDHGDAADVFFYKDGRRLDWENPDDLPLFEEIVRRGKAAGLTGFGAGPGYMQSGSMHIGFGAPAVWGADGRAANAPTWLRNAFSGQSAGPILASAGKGFPTAGGQRPAPQKPGGSFWSAPISAIKNLGIPPIFASAGKLNPQQMRGALTPMLQTVAGRTMLLDMMLPSNIGQAPTVTPGHSGAGTRAMAVAGQGALPVMLSSSGGGSGNSPQSDGRNPAGQNMDVYRANAAVLGGNGFTQDNINKALAGGATLFKRA